MHLALCNLRRCSLGLADGQGTATLLDVPPTKFCQFPCPLKVHHIERTQPDLFLLSPRPPGLRNDGAARCPSEHPGPVDRPGLLSGTGYQVEAVAIAEPSGLLLDQPPAMAPLPFRCDPDLRVVPCERQYLRSGVWYLGLDWHGALAHALGKPANACHGRNLLGL